MSGPIKIQVNDKGLAIFTVNFVIVNVNIQVPAQCNSIQFINQGTSTVTIGGGLTLAPQQSIAIDGNKYEWDNTNYQVQFDTSAGDFNNLVVVRKVYQTQ